ncbi:MAG: response regulator [SAR324 cluster bacterium]|nr:response regulator [SAR324 cluster bacterium]
MSKVLYVDHDLERIIQIQELLSSQHNLEVALNGWEGLAAAMLYKPDIVLFNLNARIMDGVEAVRLLRTEEALCQLPVLGFTLPKSEEIERIALQVGCTQILENPFHESLSQVIAEFFSEDHLKKIQE